MEDMDCYDRLLTVVKRNTQMGDVEKNCAMSVIMRFAAEVSDVRYHVGRNSIQMFMGGEPGDVQWMRENVFRFEDGTGVRSESRIKERADRMVQLYRDAGGEGKMGWLVLVNLLDSMYMDYDIWVM